MADQDVGPDRGVGDEVAHSDEEKAAFEEGVEAASHYAELLIAHEEGLLEDEAAEKDRVRANTRPGYERQSRLDRVEERHADRRVWLGVFIGLLLFAIIVAVGVFYFGSGENPFVALGSDRGSPSDSSVPADEGLEGTQDGGRSDDGTVSGTWVVYSDQAKSFAIYELTFQSNGPAVCYLSEPPIEYVVDSWSYAQDGETVEIEIKQRIIDDRFGVDEPSDAWFHMTLADGIMTGRWEQDIFGYEAVGDTAGTVYRQGIHEMGSAVYAEPKPQGK